MSLDHYDAIILGGGAAGLMCALTAGKRGKRVLVLEASNKLGKKILMSGGGRCNFTNLDIQSENFLSQNPHFCKSALKQYNQWDFISMVATHGIAYEERKHQQLFCVGSSKEVLAMLKTECEAVGVEYWLSAQAQAVDIADRQVEISLMHRDTVKSITAKNLIVATGGLSIPTLGGATGFAYQLAEQLNICLLYTSPSPRDS